MSNTRPIVCVIDDDPLIRGTIRTILDAAGYRVADASDGEAGLAIVEQLDPDLVITDIIMPGRDGIEIVRETKRRLPSVPVLAISVGGRAGPETFLNYARKLGADDCLAKPFTSDELMKRVRTLCRRPQTERDDQT